MSFAQRVLHFLMSLNPDLRLPDGIAVMNPYKDPELIKIVKQFYDKYYSDSNKRHILLGINPGRFGAGVTGIPFTDTKRLSEICGITFNGKITHEPSSVFVYDLIKEYGGAEKFYSHFYIGAVCPLGFVKLNKGKPVNYNYYDQKDLMLSVYDFILSGLKSQLELGIKRDAAFCLGTSDNYKFLQKLNGKENFFKKIIPLDHPRYIMQYKAKSKDLYIKKYVSALTSFD